MASPYKSCAHSALVPLIPGFSDADSAQKAVGDTSQERAQKHPGTDADYLHLKEAKLEVSFSSPQKVRFERNVKRQIFQKREIFAIFTVCHIYCCHIYCIRTFSLYKLHFRYIAVATLTNI